MVSQLSQKYGVSEETIRRDLEKLEQEGYAKKSYGGAVINENAGADMPFIIRKKRNVADKKKIAELASSLIQDGDRIMLDASTTAAEIARAIKGKERLTVITNSIEILLELSEVSGWQVISTGGTVKEEYLALLGPRTEEAIQSYYVDKTFLSCKAADLNKGIMDSNESFAHAKQLMLQAARECILAVDHSKLGQESFVRVAELGRVQTVITDEKPSGEWLEYLESRGIQCIYPEK